MADTIYILNGSRKLDIGILLGVIRELDSIRAVNIQQVKNVESFLDNIVEETFERKREQTHYDRLLRKINATKELNNLWREGKLIIVDTDLYSDSTNNWCFGGFCPTKYGLGYLLVSTARFEDNTLAKQVLHHEIGHMFGAPSEGRTNTIEELGLHCTNDLCAMQQKITVSEARKYAHKIEKKDLFPYCLQCTEDIQKYRFPE